MSNRERVSEPPSKGLKRMRLCRLEQDVPLLAERQFYHAFRREVLGLQGHLLVRNGDVVDAQPAALDLPPRLAIRSDETRFHKSSENTKFGFELAARDTHGRKVFRDHAFLKSLPRGFGCGVRGIATVQQRGCFGCKHLFGFVDL